jgi:hypothetical protein
MTRKASKARILQSEDLKNIFNYAISNGLQLPFFWVIVFANGEKTSGYTENSGENEPAYKIAQDLPLKDFQLPADLFLFDRNGDGDRVIIAASGKAQCFYVTFA